MPTAILIAAALAFQAATTAPVIDNPRVRVWRGAPPAGVLENDSVSVFISDGLTHTAGATFTPKGSATFSGGNIVIGPGAGAVGITPGGSSDSQTATLTVELKDFADQKTPNDSGYPDAFPRPGITQLLDNDRVTVWDYRWTPGEPTPMHYHSRDVVVMFLEEGTLASTTPAGDVTPNDYQPGTIRYNTRDRVHTETLTRGRQRAIIVELK